MSYDVGGIPPAAHIPLWPLEVPDTPWRATVISLESTALLLDNILKYSIYFKKYKTYLLKYSNPKFTFFKTRYKFYILITKTINLL